MKSLRIEDRKSFSLTLIRWTNYNIKRLGWHLKLIASTERLAISGIDAFKSFYTGEKNEQI
jgi:hypothetical protein